MGIITFDTKVCSQFGFKNKEPENLANFVMKRADLVIFCQIWLLLVIFGCVLLYYYPPPNPTPPKIELIWGRPTPPPPP